MAVWLGFPTGTQLGGKIIFPKNHDIGIEAIQGSALFWYSKFKNGFDDERTQFARCPIIQGNPYFLTWVFFCLKSLPENEPLLRWRSCAQNGVQFS